MHLIPFPKILFEFLKKFKIFLKLGASLELIAVVECFLVTQARSCDLSSDADASMRSTGIKSARYLVTRYMTLQSDLH
jgi:hypothetical protein